MSTYTIESFSNTLNLHQKQRLVIKAFKTSDAMYKFLATGDNSLKWRESNKGLKAGTYIERYAGNGKFEYLNVKNIDPSALAHM